MRVDEALVLDWVVETVLLQIVQEALHNVWRHSDAEHVDIVIEPSAASSWSSSAVVPAATVRIIDDGMGFDPATVREGPGIATMRASAAVVEGTCAIASALGAGTTITARLGPGPSLDADGDERPEPTSPPVLRLVD